MGENPGVPGAPGGTRNLHLGGYTEVRELDDAELGEQKIASLNVRSRCFAAAVPIKASVQASGQAAMLP